VSDHRVPEEYIGSDDHDFLDVTKITLSTFVGR